MATLGYTSIGASSSPIETGGDSNEDTIAGTAFTATENGTCDQVTVYLDFVIAARQTPRWNVKVAVYEYDDVSGTHDLIVEGETLNLGYGATDGPANDGWYDFALDSTLNMVSGTAYLLVAWAEQETASGSSSCKLRLDAETGYDYEDEPEPYGATWPDPLDPTTTVTDFRASMYFTYTATAAGPTAGTLALMGVGK